MYRVTAVFLTEPRVFARIELSYIGCACAGHSCLRKSASLSVKLLLTSSHRSCAPVASETLRCAAVRLMSNEQPLRCKSFQSVRHRSRSGDDRHVVSHHPTAFSFYYLEQLLGSLKRLCFLPGKIPAQISSLALPDGYALRNAHVDFRSVDLPDAGLLRDPSVNMKTRGWFGASVEKSGGCILSSCFKHASKTGGSLKKAHCYCCTRKVFQSFPILAIAQMSCRRAFKKAMYHAILATAHGASAGCALLVNRPPDCSLATKPSNAGFSLCHVEAVTENVSRSSIPAFCRNLGEMRSGRADILNCQEVIASREKEPSLCVMQ